MTPIYDRVVLKVSGEALMGKQDFGIDPDVIKYVASQIRDLAEMRVRISVVIGAGNIFRGTTGAAEGMDRARADSIGMIATVINSLTLHDRIEKLGVDCRILSAISINRIVETYTIQRALEHLEKRRVLLLAAGTGNPYFTTDTAAVLRASETGSQVVLKATKVDGLYDSDPKKNPDAKLIRRISYMEALKKGLKVMDLTAISLAMENLIPVIIFNIRKKGSISTVVCGERTGSIIEGEKI